MTPLNGWLLSCRSGFENDCIQQARAQLAEQECYADFSEHPGFVLAETADGVFNIHELIFVRQLFQTFMKVEDLPENDRVAPLVNAISSLPISKQNGPFDGLYIECPDTDDGQGLKRFCNSFHKPMERALQKAELLNKSYNTGQHNLRLHIFFPSYDHAYIGVSTLSNASKWPLGIPRLKLPKSSPSRAALKLEEVFNVMMNKFEQKRWLAEGMHAVDLGAAPGGWTSSLLKRGMFVTAIDNGKMDAKLMETDMVNHIASDAFKYVPKARVDWMVCDIIDKPRRNAELLATWIRKGMCERAIVTLKLPMKKRYDEVKQCLRIIEAAMAERPKDYDQLRVKQLYHNRQEITVLLARNVNKKRW